MAKPKPEEDLDLDVEKTAPAPKKSGKMKIILIAVAALVLAAGIAGGAWFFLHKSADAGDNTASAHEGAAGEKGGKAKKAVQGKKGGKDVQAAPAVFLALDPAFVVNFEDQGVVRFLQITVEVGARDPRVLDAVKQYMPIIRNNLVMLFSSQDLKSITSRPAKEQLRAEALTEIRKVLEEQTGDPGVENVYFTSFVMQ